MKFYTFICYLDLVVFTNWCHLLGVSIIEDGADGITLELELQWDGNPSIILDINTRLGVALPVQVFCNSFVFISWNK